MWPGKGSDKDAKEILPCLPARPSRVLKGSKEENAVFGPTQSLGDSWRCWGATRVPEGVRALCLTLDTQPARCLAVDCLR